MEWKGLGRALSWALKGSQDKQSFQNAVVATHLQDSQERSEESFVHRFLVSFAFHKPAQDQSSGFRKPQIVRTCPPPYLPPRHTTSAMM